MPYRLVGQLIQQWLSLKGNKNLEVVQFTRLDVSASNQSMWWLKKKNGPQREWHY